MFEKQPTTSEIADRLYNQAPDGFDEDWDRVVANLASVLITSWDRLNHKEQSTVFDVAAQLHRYRLAGTLPHVENPIVHNDDGSYTLTFKASSVGAEEQIAERPPAE